MPVLQNQMDPIFNTTAVHLDPQQPRPTDHVTLDRESGSPDDITSSTASSVADGGQAIGDSSVKPSTNGLENSQLVEDLTSTVPSEGKEVGNAMAYSSIQTAIESNSAPHGLDVPESVLDGKSGNVDLHSLFAGSVENGESTTSHTSQPFQDTPPPAPLMTSASTAGSTEQDNVQPSKTNGSERTSLPSSQVNYQALLDNLIQPNSSPFPTANSTSSVQEAEKTPTNQTALNSTNSPSSNLLVNATLPPRPPPSEKIADDTSQDDPRSLHLQIAGSSAINASNTYSTQPFRAPPGFSAPVVAAGAPGTSSAASGLPPPPGATFQQPAQQIPSTANVQQRVDAIDRPASLSRDQDEAPWGPETQKLYDQFLQDERVYVAEAQWEKFPADSRLFVGENIRIILKGLD
jgi:hypothetical protein